MDEIKDRRPNLEVIDHLEALLEKAKSGEIRTFFCICGWNDDTYSSGWVFDRRNSMLKFLGRLSLVKTEVETAMIVQDEDTDLTQAIRGWM